MKKTVCILFFACPILISAQQNRIWNFGVNAGLDFNTTPPTALTTGQTNVLDYTSSISDGSGNLLFYTDGMTVWNKNNMAMPNGTGLTGNTTAGQSALIVPVPGDPARYVIFHLSDFANPGYLKYSVVDMNLASGLGDVDAQKKNISLGSGWAEKLCAYYNPQGSFYWVLAHRWGSNEFVAFKVTATSVATQSVSTMIGTIHNSGTYAAPHDCMGELTISPQGNRVVNAVTNQNILDFFDFDLNTGVLSNSVSVSVPCSANKVFGAAFSPDGRKVYVTGLYGTSLLQYDLSNYSATAIAASQTTIGNTTSGTMLYMELGPDKKLYIAKYGQNSLAVVNNPDVTGAGCNFSLSGVSLGSKVCNAGLSRIAYNIPEYIPTAISASGVLSQANAFPNPFSGNLTIEPNGASSVSIFNCFGQLVYSNANASTSFEVNTAALPSGVYFLSAKGQKGEQVMKLIKD